MPWALFLVKIDFEYHINCSIAPKKKRNQFIKNEQKVCWLNRFYWFFTILIQSKVRFWISTSCDELAISVPKNAKLYFRYFSIKNEFHQLFSLQHNLSFANASSFNKINIYKYQYHMVKSSSTKSSNYYKS